MTTELSQTIDQAVSDGHLLSSSADNIRHLLASSDLPLYHDSVSELVEQKEWSELNDRFYQTLKFGTGGLRGRSIGKIITSAEQGAPQALDRPEFPCVGTNVVNFYNLTRATAGYVRSLKANNPAGRTSIVIAHDTRHFAVEFAAHVAKVATENGVDVYLFTSPRSTPELSFAVRHLNATGGIVLTASHNPPHDSGFKVYWNDGAQAVEPHASNIVDHVNAAKEGDAPELSPDELGKITEIGEEIDTAYMDTLETLLLDPDAVAQENDLKIVFTNLHGTGGRIAPAMLRRLGFDCATVAEQDIEDGRFPTVDSPNPENAPALAMAVEQAQQEGADLVIATDPDCDRMGVAVRDGDEMKLLTGNQIGSLMGWYRIKTFFDQGILNESNRKNAVLVKTFVTTGLQEVIADSFDIRCVDTLTGFKYIGEKLGKYEKQIPAELRKNYRQMPELETRALRLEHSSFFVFGGEESYGYLGSDVVRDKDGNGAVVMFAELAVYAKSQGFSIAELLDQIYSEYGYFQEQLHSVVMEGAQGAGKIQTLAKSYSINPPQEVDGSKVSEVLDFATQEIQDVEGDTLPKENMLIVKLEDGRSFAVRPSGTEPKIKYYLYGKQLPEAGSSFETSALPQIKEKVGESLKSLWTWLEKDIDVRLG
ncbi:MAG: phospho-sugar mutase [Verrucomicrobiales bacterium]|nr:phospho-sugar mutase [Verrucomicrobiales bacterium]